MSQCNCHCEVTNLACGTCCLLVKIFLLILCLEIDINIIKREVVYSSFLLILFLFYFLFFLSIPRRSITKITMRDFNQEVTFKQYFYLHQQFMFLCANCFLSICLFFFVVFFCVCVFRLLQN